MRDAHYHDPGDGSGTRDAPRGRQGREAWRARSTWTGRGALAAAAAVTAVWAWVLLGRTPEFLPWLRWVVLGVGLVAAAAMPVRPSRRGWVAAATAAAVLAGTAGPAAYALETAATPHRGSIPTAGPGTSTAGDLPGPDGFRASTPGDEGTGAALAALLAATDTRWAAATVGAQGAASLMLSTGRPVMAIGGFMGMDPSPTLAQFQALVADGEVRYAVTGGATGPGGRNNEIAAWVQGHFAAQTVDGRTVYDLTAPVG